MSSITPHAVDAYKRKRKKEGISEVTINRELAFLKNMFNVAIQWGKATENPMLKVEMYREDNSRTRYLTEEEEERLLAECKPHIYRVVLAAIHTGLRCSELLSLKWNNINFEHRLVTVEAGYSKNGEARSVSMSLRLTETLEEVRISDPNAPVFLNSLGEPNRDVKRSFNSAVKRDGIEDFVFHDLRYTFASRLVMSGVDLATVKELMGHKNISMTMRYAHLSPEHRRAAIEVFDRVPGIFPPRSENENVHPLK